MAPQQHNAIRKKQSLSRNPYSKNSDSSFNYNYPIMNKKSQLTIFIIIVMLLVVLSVVFFIAVSKVYKNSSDIATISSLQASKTFSLFDTYMQSCLDDALSDGLLHIGRQGGVLYPYQKGSTIKYPIRSASFDSRLGNKTVTYNVTYINEPLPPSYVYSNDYYPCIMSSFGWTQSSFNKILRDPVCLTNYSHALDGFRLQYSWQIIGNTSFQENVFVPLCSSAHIVNLPAGVLNPSQGELNMTVCQNPPAIQRNFSIQSQLESYLKYRINDCFLDAIQSLEDAGITTVNIGVINTSVKFNEESTVAQVFFPLTLEAKRANAITKQFSYYSISRVRLRTIYAVLYGSNVMIKQTIPLNNGQNVSFLKQIPEGIITTEMHNLTYRIVEDSKKLMSDYGISNITLYRAYDRTNSYVLVLIDNGSSLYGEPYQYHVRFFNRQPALDTIKSSYSSGDIDIVTHINGSLILNPLGFDPDDQGSIQLPMQYTYEPLGNWSWRKNSFFENGYFLTGVQRGLFCFHPLYGITPNRCTALDLNSSDLGLHQLKISVIDKQGSSDSQTLSILVDYYPNISFRIQNIYSMIDPAVYPDRYIDGSDIRYIISQEDPFILNTSESITSIGPYANLFAWSLEGKSANDISITHTGHNQNQKVVYPFNYSASNSVIVHPGFENFSNFIFLTNFLSSTHANKIVRNQIDQVLVHFYNYKSMYDIFNITDYSFPFSVSTGSTNLKSRIKVSYFKQSELTDFYYKPVLITKCVPYRSEIPSYPYNLFRQDNSDRTYIPYLSNHTCCLGNPNDPESWSPASLGTPCFYYYDIVTYDEAMNLEGSNISTAIFEEIYQDYSLNRKRVPEIKSPNSIDLDRYVRVLTGSCDGNRGNICRPDVFEIYRIPYCGAQDQNNPSRPSQVNTTVLFTGITTDVSNYMGDNAWLYPDDLCVCQHNGVTVIANKSSVNSVIRFDVRNKPIPVGEKYQYCCYGPDGLPNKILPHPCVLPECIHATESAANPVGDVYFDPENNVRMHYCTCGSDPNQIADTDDIHSAYYCCRWQGPTGELTLTADHNNCKPIISTP